MKSNKEVTIYGLVRGLNKSPSKVSRALCNNLHISKETIGQIKKVAHEMIISKTDLQVFISESWSPLIKHRN